MSVSEIISVYPFICSIFISLLLLVTLFICRRLAFQAHPVIGVLGCFSIIAILIIGYAFALALLDFSIYITFSIDLLLTAFYIAMLYIIIGR